MRRTVDIDLAIAIIIALSLVISVVVFIVTALSVALIGGIAHDIQEHVITVRDYSKYCLLQMERIKAATQKTKLPSIHDVKTAKVRF